MAATASYGFRFGRGPEIQAGEAPAGGGGRRCPDMARLASPGFAPRVALGEDVGRPAESYLANVDHPANSTLPLTSAGEQAQ